MPRGVCKSYDPQNKQSQQSSTAHKRHICQLLSTFFMHNHVPSAQQHKHIPARHAMHPPPPPPLSCCCLYITVSAPLHSNMMDSTHT